MEAAAAPDAPAPSAAATPAASQQSADRERVLATIKQMVLYIWEDMTGADFADAIPEAMRDKLRQHMPSAKVAKRPRHGARMLDDRGDVKLWRLISVLKTCVEMLSRDAATTTKREIYYSEVELFGKKQATADRAIEQAVQLIANIDGSFGSFARDSLGIVAAKRGMCYGSLIYTLVDGNKFNAALGSGISIEPGAAFQRFYLVDSLESILVVEKETVFHRLAKDMAAGKAEFLKTKTLLVTGKGYPDVATRSFLRALLKQEPQLKVYGLVDGDPHGMDIMSVYINGSKGMKYAGKSLCVPEVKWLGVRFRDLEKWGVPDHALLPLGKRDKSVASRLLANQAQLATVHPDAADHVRSLVELGKKAEIESLNEIEGGLLKFLEATIPLIDAEPERTADDAAAPMEGGAASGDETEEEAESAAPAGAAAAALGDGFSSDDDGGKSSDDDDDGAKQCGACGKWSSGKMWEVQGEDHCYACWRRQHDGDERPEQDAASTDEEAEAQQLAGSMSAHSDEGEERDGLEESQFLDDDDDDGFESDASSDSFVSD